MAAARRRQGQEELDEALSDWMENLKLKGKLGKEEKKINYHMKKLKLMKLQQYAVDLTLDPGSAHPKLILSECGKQVQLGYVWQNVQDSPHRFNHSFNVLAKEGFSEGRFYFEVQVRWKTQWTIGVARESISRKGPIIVAPSHGIWAIRMKNENEYEACVGPPDRLPPGLHPQKVGVFVDYEQGLVSFYDADTAHRICKFKEFHFTEKLYPFFSPGPDDRGRNSAPLVITPVRK